MREDCDRFRVIASLRPDDELSGLERAVHHAHAASCEDCRAYAAEVAGLTACIRSTPPQGLQRRIVVAGRPLRQRVVSVAAALAIGVVIAAGVGELPREGAAPPLPSAGGAAGGLKAI